MQIPKFQKDTTKYFQYETSPNPTSQDDLQALLKSDHSVMECLIDGLWQPETVYKENMIVRSPNMPAGYNARVTKSGTSGTNEPDWGGTSVTDGTVEWKVQKQGSGGGSGASWESETFYNKDSTVSLEGNTSLFLLCITSGTSGSTQPTVDGENNVVDGSVTWKPIYYKKLPTLDENNYIKGENLSGYWKPNTQVLINTLCFLQGDRYAGIYLKCSQAGSTGSVQPSVNPESPLGQEVIDGTAKWKQYIISGNDIISVKDSTQTEFTTSPSAANEQGKTTEIKTLKGITKGDYALQDLLKSLSLKSHSHEAVQVSFNCNCVCDCYESDSCSCSSCIIEGDILTSKGNISIKDLKIGDEVISLDGCKYKVKGIKKSYLGKRKAIYFGGLNSAIFTDDHLFISSNGDYFSYNVEGYKEEAKNILTDGFVNGTYSRKDYKDIYDLKNNDITFNLKDKEFYSTKVFIKNLDFKTITYTPIVENCEWVYINGIPSACARYTK